MSRLISLAANAAAWPLRALSHAQRAGVLEQLMDEMISVTSIPGGTLRFFSPGPVLHWRATSVLFKEPELIHWIDAMKEGSVLWDIGANVGVYSLYAARRKCRSVVAFEPSASNYYILTKNIHLNGLQDRIAAYCMALADRTGLGVLHIPSPSVGAAQNQFASVGTASACADVASANSHGMLGFSIDSFMDLFSPPFPNYLKLDVDGIEPAILRGAKSTLADPRLLSVIVELSIDDQDGLRTTSELLKAAGLQYSSRGMPQAMDGYQVANYVFVREPVELTVEVGQDRPLDDSATH